MGSLRTNPLDSCVSVSLSLSLLRSHNPGISLFAVFSLPPIHLLPPSTAVSAAIQTGSTDYLKGQGPFGHSDVLSRSWWRLY